MDDLIKYLKWSYALHCKWAVEQASKGETTLATAFESKAEEDFMILQRLDKEPVTFSQFLMFRTAVVNLSVARRFASK